MLLSPTVDHHGGFISLLAQRWHAWRERRDSLAALERCGDGEMARMARDLSMSAGELRSLAGRGPGAAGLLYRRMDDVGLDRDLVARGDTGAMRDMQRICSLCSSKRRCRHDLASGAAASAWQPYCPNDDTLMALVAGGAHGARRVGARAPAIGDDRHGARATLLGLLFVALAWLVLLAAPPATNHSSLRPLTPIAPPQAAAALAVDCLDAGCLSTRQQSAIAELRAVQAQGWIASSTEEIASLPRAATLVQAVQAGEALACRRAGGATYYGLMFESGCSSGAAEAAKLDSFNECRPMAAGGVCLVK